MTSGGAGSRQPILNAESLASGTALFTSDLRRPNMLHCCLRYSDHPHARIRSISTTRAAMVPGVVVIITAADVPEAFLRPVGLSVADRELLVRDTVRCMNDVVAAVAAEDGETAAAAVELIEVEYEVLPAILSTADAVAENAPPVHSEKHGYGVADYVDAYFVRDSSNVATELRFERGDVDAARSGSAVVVENHFSTQRMEHFSMEPHAVLAEYDPVAERLEVWCSTGKPFRILNQLAPVLDLPLSRIKLVAPHVGGDFGGKGELTLEPYCGQLAMITGRPVKGVYTRSEEITASSHKTPFDIDMQIGLDAAGQILYMDADIVSDTGAHDTYASMVQIHGATHLSGTYVVPNLSVRARVLYTNNINSGSFRGFGSPQVTFARESLLDEAASRLGLDPIVLRLKNAWVAGATTSTGEVLDSERYGVSVTDCLAAAARRWSALRNRRRLPKDEQVRYGIGIASGHQGIGGGIWAGADSGTVIVKANLDGTMAVTVGVGDVGQGASTTMAQIVAEELRLPLSSLSVNRFRDTDEAPYDAGASASRQVFVSGSAAHAAGAQMRAQLIAIAADVLEIQEEDLIASEGRVHVKGTPQRGLSYEDLVRHSINALGLQPIAVGSFSSKVSRLDEELRGAPFQAFDYVTQIAEVEVDADTGVVKVIGLWTFQDVGKAINPMIVEGQIEGGATQGIGFALMERIVLDEGRVINPLAFDYRIPRFADTPHFTHEILEHANPRGPYGAKGAGEAPMIPTAAAVANAIKDAVGVRLTSLPMLPQDIWAATVTRAADLDATRTTAPA